MAEPPFSLTARPGSFIWKEPPQYDTWDNVPKHNVYSAKLTDFTRARLSVSAKAWRVRPDHGGLILAIFEPGARSSHGDAKPTPLRWLRVGPELLKPGLAITVSASDRFADQSMHPLAHQNDEDWAGEEITVEVRRETSIVGSILWVYYLILASDGAVLERHPLRQCTWFFDGEARGLEVEVGAYAARPAVGEIAHGEPLELWFSNFVVEE